MTTLITTSGEDYTWLSADHSWSNPLTGDRPIGGYSIHQYALTLPETFALAESTLFGFIRRLNAFETLKVTSRHPKSISRPLRDGFNVSDSGRGVTEYHRAYAESFRVTSDALRNPGLGLNEQLRVSDTVTHSAVAQLQSGFALTDLIAKTPTFAVKEQIHVSDALKTAYSLLFSEQVALQSGSGRIPTKSFYSSFGLDDDVTKSAQLRLSESVSIAEILSNAPTKQLRDAFELTDQRPVFKATKDSRIRLRFAEVLGNSVQFHLAEALAVSDAIASAYTLQRSEAFRVRDSQPVFSATKAVYSTLEVADAVAKSLQYHLAEQLRVSDLLGNVSTKQLRDSFRVVDRRPNFRAMKAVFTTLKVDEAAGRNTALQLTDAFAVTANAFRVNYELVSDEYFDLVDRRPVFGFEKPVSETLTIVDKFARSAAFKRNFKEALAITDRLHRALSKAIWESFKASDAFARDANLVISDMVISTLPMTPKLFDEFIKYGNIPGYARWRDFVPGDYEYQEAMVRGVLESKNSDRGLLQTMQVTVDVPDLIDRGLATVVNADAGVRVNFNRRFHIIPEITVAVRGGMGDLTIIPKIIGAPDLNGFTAILQDSNNNKVTGSFTWAAHGY